MKKIITSALMTLTILSLCAFAQEKKEEVKPIEVPELDYLKDAKVSIMQFSHQDLGWHAGSYKGEMKNVHRSIDKAMQMIEEDERFVYDGELVVWLHNYVRLHPDKVEALKKHIQAGKINWGAGYTQPYTSLLTSEQVARLMYLGRGWFKKQFDADTTLWYNTDVPGMTAQFPQILAKSGIDKAYLCRSWNIDGIKTDFLNWYSPDGTSVFVFMMNHYGDYIEWKPATPTIANDYAKMTKWIAGHESEYAKRKIAPVLPHLLSKDNVGPRTDIIPLMDNWNKFAEKNNLPPMIYDSLTVMIDKVKASKKSDFKELKGDWPHRWVYEAAPANYKMFTDNRNASRLLTAAESFGVFRAVLDGSWENYPTEKLFQSWCEADLSCHGIAPDSCVENFLKVYANARKNGQAMLDETLNALAAKVKTTYKDQPVILFNNLSWDRTEVVKMDLPEGMTDCVVLNKDGKPVESQISGKQVLFVAKDVPSFGYSTYYLKKTGKQDKGKSQAEVGKTWNQPFENDFFKVTPGKQGIAGIFDKELERELLKTDKFEAAQWMNFVYTGQGAGEHTHVKLPEKAGLDKLGLFTATWICKESGPLFTTFESKEVATPRGKVSFQLRMYSNSKRIDLSCKMLDCDEEASQQIRLAFPLNADFDNIAFEAPFGKVEIGKDEIQRHLAFKVEPTQEQVDELNERLKTVKKGWKKRMLWTEVHGEKAVRPREIQNWIYAGDGKAGVTIGSSVIAWDYMDASHNPVKYPVLQPVMLCSAHSCNRWKDYWRQPGDHEFTFSIYSHAGDWRNGRKKGVAHNNPLIPVMTKENSAGELPATYSFLKVSSDNIIVTAVKKSEHSDDIAVRFYETDGVESTKVELTPAFKIKDARRTNLIEEDAGRMKHSSQNASMTVGKYSIETIKLVPKM